MVKLDSTVDALPCYVDEKNIHLFSQHRVLSENELRSRMDIGLDAYAKIIGIEARTMLMMARREILPAVVRYAGEIAEAGEKLNRFSKNAPRNAAENLAVELCQDIEVLKQGIDHLAAALEKAPAEGEPLAIARYMKDVVQSRMAELRKAADDLEVITDRKAWPFPTYDELLFNI